MFIPYQPEGPPPTAVSTENPIQWAPLNNPITPSPMKRSDLPVFTSTSAIPFGVNPKFGVKKEEVKDDSIREVPETPEGK